MDGCDRSPEAVKGDKGSVIGGLRVHQEHRVEQTPVVRNVPLNFLDVGFDSVRKRVFFLVLCLFSIYLYCMQTTKALE